MNSTWNQCFTDFFTTNRCFQEFKAHSTWVGEKQQTLQTAADHFWLHTDYEKPNLCVALFNLTPQIRFMVYLTRNTLKLTFCSVTQKEMDRAFKSIKENRNIPAAFQVNEAVLGHFDFMQIFTLSAHQITPLAARLGPLILERTSDEHLV